VAPNKMDLIPGDERAEFLDYIRETALPQHWDGAVTPSVMGISALAALHPEEHDESDLVASFENLRERLEQVADEERGALLLARRGNPEKQLFAQAKELEGEDKYDRAHRIYFDLLDILAAADLDPTPAEEGIARCEEHLSEQVDALDELNERYNEAMALAEEDPDAALEQLKAIRDEKEDLRLEEGDVGSSIEAIRERIQKRKDSREAIRRWKSAVEQHRRGEEWIKAASKAQKILQEIDTAELPEEKASELRSFVQSQKEKRDEWLKKSWPMCREEVESYLENGDLKKAQEIAERFSQVPSSALNGDEIQKTISRLEEEETYRESLLNFYTRIHLLREKKVEPSTGLSIWQDVEQLKKKYEKLYGNVELDPASSINTQKHALSIDQKIQIVKSVEKLVDDRKNPIQDLKEELLERKQELRKVNTAVPRRRKKIFSEYPDHPAVAGQNPDTLTNLERACKRGDPHRLQQIIRNGGKILVNIKSHPAEYDGGLHTPLMLAAREGHSDVIRLLLGAGADSSVKSKNGFTALTIAVYEGNTECVRTLIERGADPGTSDENGLNALDWAIMEGNMQEADIMFRSGCLPNKGLIRGEGSKSCVHKYNNKGVCEKCNSYYKNRQKSNKNKRKNKEQKNINNYDKKINKELKFGFKVVFISLLIAVFSISISECAA